MEAEQSADSRRLKNRCRPEEYFNTEFGGAKRTYVTLTMPDLGGDYNIAEIQRFEDVAVISRIVDPDEKEVYPFVTLLQ